MIIPYLVKSSSIALKCSSCFLGSLIGMRQNAPPPLTDNPANKTSFKCPNSSTKPCQSFIVGLSWPSISTHIKPLCLINPPLLRSLNNPDGVQHDKFFFKALRASLFGSFLTLSDRGLHLSVLRNENKFPFASIVSVVFQYILTFVFIFSSPLFRWLHPIFAVIVCCKRLRGTVTVTC